MTETLISCDEAIGQILDALYEIEGELLAEIFSKVVRECEYIGDSMIRIKEN